MRRGLVPCQPALAMRVFTRPVIGRSSPARDRGVDAAFRPRLTSGVLAPGSLAPLRRPVPRVRKDIRASSWPLRFSSPEALAAPFVSPRNQHGSHSALAARPRSSREWLAQQDEGHTCPSPEAVRPRRPTPRHPQVRTSPDLPPSGRTQDKCAEEVWDNFPICFSQSFGIARELPRKRRKNMWGSRGFSASDAVSRSVILGLEPRIFLRCGVGTCRGTERSSGLDLRSRPRMT
jgi:hypothetical protein